MLMAENNFEKWIEFLESGYVIVKRITRSFNIVCKNKIEVFIKYYFYLN